MISNKTILLVICGGIAAYKALELIRLLRKEGAEVRTIMTQAAQKFITPLSVSTLSGSPVYTDLFSLKDEREMGHIRLSREADMIVIAPATANIMAKMAHGLADDLASTTLLASDKPILVCPAMNPQMWNAPAMQSNIRLLKERGVLFAGPSDGDVACQEHGTGRLMDLEDIIKCIRLYVSMPKILSSGSQALSGKTVLVTAGPTHEPIDPVRYIGNRSSGKQGYAIASALHDLGADVHLVSGPSSLPPPAGVSFYRVETAQQMLEETLALLPVDLAICTAAVADFSPDVPSASKLKKTEGQKNISLELKTNPDILFSISSHKNRPKLVIGFAAETESLLENAREKLHKKMCDWIVANEISPENPTFGEDVNTVHLLTKTSEVSWPKSNKSVIATLLAEKIVAYFADKTGS